jgi:hypothetical protein
MKKLYIVFLLLCCFNTYAQKSRKIDSVYYLLDTTKTSVNDRMWEIELESEFKYYTLQCPCLQFDNKPTFLYKVDINKGQIIKRKNLKSIKFIKLSDLIIDAKKYADVNFNKKFVFFFVEPYKKDFICHQIGLLFPKKRSVSIDYEVMPLDTSKIKKP